MTREDTLFHAYIQDDVLRIRLIVRGIVTEIAFAEAEIRKLEHCILAWRQHQEDTP